MNNKEIFYFKPDINLQILLSSSIFTFSSTKRCSTIDQSLPLTYLWVLSKTFEEISMKIREEQAVKADISQH